MIHWVVVLFADAAEGSVSDCGDGLLAALCRTRTESEGSLPCKRGLGYAPTSPSIFLGTKGKESQPGVRRCFYGIVGQLIRRFLDDGTRHAVVRHSR